MKVRTLALGSWALFILAAGAGLFVMRSATRPPESFLAVLGTVPDFTLETQSGKAFGSGDLRGKVWIADFIFTRCSGICPLMSAKMRELQNRFKYDPDIRFVSFSVDPDYDTTEVLTAYAGRFSADAQKWSFLTGSQETIHELSLQHFHLGVGEVPAEERPQMDQWIRHSAKFVLVDGEGRIRGYYSSEDENSLRQLEEDARRLMAAIR